MIGQTVKAYDSNRNLIEGKVMLIYTDALASGTRDYVPITYILIKDINNNAVSIIPRDIVEFLSDKIEARNDKNGRIPSAFKVDTNI